jgi:hypothetical protein
MSHPITPSLFTGTLRALLAGINRGKPTLKFKLSKALYPIL